MSMNAGSRSGALLGRWWSTTDWILAADIFAVLLALALPWSTSLVGIFAVIWLLSLIPAFDVRRFADMLKRTASMAPIALAILSIVGMIWAAGIPWPARFHGLNPVAKLLLIPFLFYHFSVSRRALWVGIAFLASCTLVMIASWLMFVDPRFVFGATRWLNVPVKNYIAQSQEFAFCAFCALGAAVYLLGRDRKVYAAAMAGLGMLFLANLVFVVSSRTVLVCIPFLLILFAIVHFGRKGVAACLALAVVVAVAAWAASPSLRARAFAVETEYDSYLERNAASSTGMRLEFWSKSIKFIEQAPLIGHGTGSTKALFEQDAVGKMGVSAEVIGNPHNQTLNVGVQWGALGILILYVMWFAHLRLFAGLSGLTAWVGLVAVVENFISSLFNSHLFDFTEGWVYVLAVGVAGGVILGNPASRDSGPGHPVPATDPRRQPPANPPAGLAVS